MKEIRTVALVGLGAIGCFLAPRLQQALGGGFYVVAGGSRAGRIREGVVINGETYRFPVKERADTPADLVFVAVKRPALGEALAAARGHVGPGTVMMLLLNGLDSEECAKAAFPDAHVLYSFIRCASKWENGGVTFDPAIGLLEFGEAENRTLSAEVRAVSELFDRVGFRYKVREDMIHALWLKFLSNIGENIPCALLLAPVAALQRSEHGKALQMGGMREVVSVANAKGIALTGQDCEDVYAKTLKQAPANKPSTMQDLEAGRETEIEMFSGALLRMAAECGVRVPYTEVFYHAIKALEEKNRGLFKT